MHHHNTSSFIKILPPTTHTPPCSFYIYFLTPLCYSVQAWGLFWLATQWKWPWRAEAWEQVLFPQSIISIISPSIPLYPWEQCLTSNKNEASTHYVQGRKDSVITYCRYMLLPSWTWEGGRFNRASWNNRQNSPTTINSLSFLSFCPEHNKQTRFAYRDLAEAEEL